jgi:hypothetical protein
LGSVFISAIRQSVKFPVSKSNMAIRYCVTIDTEEEWDWNAGWPTTSAQARNIERLPEFQDVCSKYNAATTYFVNHAVVESPTSAKIVTDLSKRDSVEVGMHIHPWNTPPMADGPVKASESFVANLDDNLAWAKLKTVYDTLGEHGIKPTSFRGGRYSSGGIVHRFLREHGFIADASVVPYTTWDDDGAPDYTDRVYQPQRLQSNGEPPLWEIPLTLGFTRGPQNLWAKIFRTIETTPLRHARLIGIAERLGIVRRVWLNFEDDMGLNPQRYLERLRKIQPEYVCFTLHSSSLLPGGNGPKGYTRSEEDCQNLLRRTTESLKMLEQWAEFEPATITEIAQHLERNFDANSRN